MATTTSHPHTNPHSLPSPPSSPPRKRLHKKKPTDPFENLDNTLSTTTPPPPTSAPSPEEKESLLTRTILIPIYMTSFLISLFLIDRSTRIRRLSKHPNSNKHHTLTSFRKLFSPRTWLDPEPYQDPSDSTWARRDSHTHVEPPSALNPDGRGGRQKGTKKRRSWYLRKKIRKVARMEIGDAFEMRGRVILIMCFVLVLVCCAVFLGLRWVVGRVW